MADYYPLLARAIAGLADNTPEIRAGVYGRARQALLLQLQSSDPPLGDSDITRERLALEDAIRRVEDDHAALPEPAPFLPEEPVPPEPEPIPVPAEPARPRVPPRAERARRSRVGWIVLGLLVPVTIGMGFLAYSLNRGEGSRAVAPQADAAPAPAQQPTNDKVAERFGGAAPETPAPVSPVPFQPAPVQSTPAQTAPAQPAPAQTAPAASASQADAAPAPVAPPASSQPASPPAAAAPPRTAQVPPVASTAPPAAASPGIAVAQHAILLLQDTANPQQIVTRQGSVAWRLDSEATAGQPLDAVVKADFDFSDEKLRGEMIVRRNSDAALPASHTIEVIFRPEAGNALGDVRAIGPIEARENEQTRGVVLGGSRFPVSDNYFLIGLTNAEPLQTRNLQLLRERDWFFFEVELASGRRGAILLERSDPGRRVFAEAFDAWKQ